jgi:mono/diheme cytochrome c family protein
MRTPPSLPQPRRPRRGRPRAAIVLGAAAPLLLAACAVEWQNIQAAQAIADQARPPGSAYAGWRVFQARCAQCHGADATGAAGGPDLLPKIRTMGVRRFVDLVLWRYDWNLPHAKAAAGSRAREDMLDAVLGRQDGRLDMPPWGGAPGVSAHIVDLYAYLASRGDGTLPPGPPGSQVTASPRNALNSP